MTRDQVRCKFDEIVKPQVNQRASALLSEMLELSARYGPRPAAKTPELVKKLWV